MIEINKSDNYMITENFNIKEFFSTSQGVKHHYLDKKLIDVVQLVRSYYNSPILVTSSYRTPEHQALLRLTSSNAAMNSPHCKAIALDFQFINETVNNQFLNDLENKAEIFHILRQNGINGIGIYSNFCHIDTRTPEMHNYFNSSDSLGLYCEWNKKKV